MKAKKIYRNWRGIQTAKDCRVLGGGCFPTKIWSAMKQYKDGTKKFGYGNTELAAAKDLSAEHGITLIRIKRTK